jgi:hypothetical protein
MRRSLVRECNDPSFQALSGLARVRPNLIAVGYYGHGVGAETPEEYRPYRLQLAVFIIELVSAQHLRTPGERCTKAQPESHHT